MLPDISSLAPSSSAFSTSVDNTDLGYGSEATRFNGGDASPEQILLLPDIGEEFWIACNDIGFGDFGGGVL